jgi:hypothetical protein
VTETPPHKGAKTPADKPTEAEARMREALGPEIASDAVEVAAQVAAPRRGILPWILLAIAGIVVLQVGAALFFPPTGHDGAPYQYPADGMVGANIELPAPEVFFDPTPKTERDTGLITFDVEEAEAEERQADGRVDVTRRRAQGVDTPDGRDQAAPVREQDEEE